MINCYRGLPLVRSRNFGAVLAVAVLSVVITGAALAGPPYPRYGTRSVDGDIGDWNLTVDFYAQMYRAGDPDKPVESWLYLRYDCHTNTLYILMRGKPKVPILIDAAKTAWVAIDVISNKVVMGTPGTTGRPLTSRGWMSRLPRATRLPPVTRPLSH